MGALYLQVLIDEGDMETAAELSKEVCATRKDSWEQCCDQFEQQHCSRLLAKHLPTHSPQLEPECYEEVLKDLLAVRFFRFYLDNKAKYYSMT